MSDPTPVGIIGCGNISSIYLKNAQWLTPMTVTAVADIDQAAAEAQAAEFNVPRVLTVDEMLSDPDIELIINLTPPSAHAAVAIAVVQAGKSVYNEKPLTVAREDAQLLLTTAEANGVSVGCAPDTFLGAAHQTCRQLIDQGLIGEPMAATAFMMGWGMEMWHPSPEFFFKPGGGPLLDMGPYYLTALINLLGPVRTVSGMTRIGRKQRTITSEPLAGTVIEVQVPTHAASLLQFTNGAIGTLITSFEAAGSNLPRIEVYGTEGALSVPDPNQFNGEIRVKRPGHQLWETVLVDRPYAENSRGLGVADMIMALREGRQPRANGRLAFHVLDIMHAIQESSDSGEHITLSSFAERPALMPETAVFS